jgi:hypothetical protein
VNLGPLIISSFASPAINKTATIGPVGPHPGRDREGRKEVARKLLA